MNKGHPTSSEIFPVRPALFAWLCAPPKPPPAPLRFRALVEVAEKERTDSKEAVAIYSLCFLLK